MRGMRAVGRRIRIIVFLPLLSFCGRSEEDPPPRAGESGTSSGGAQGGSGGKVGGAQGGQDALAGAPSTGGAGTAGERGVLHPSECPSSVEESDDGFVCENGIEHRAFKASCTSRLPIDQGCFGAGGGGGVEGSEEPLDEDDPCFGASTCDLECNEHPHGHCVRLFNAPELSCVYGCTTDEECGTGEICDCGPAIGTCIPAGCVTDADCADGLLCALAVTSCYGPGTSMPWRYECQTPDDECATDADCDPDYEDRCFFQEGARRCVDENCPEY